MRLPIRIATRRRPTPFTRGVAAAQGAFYLASGVWPHLHMESFERVTGPKTDRWLVRTVGGLLAVVGGTLLSASLRDRVTPELRALGAGTAAVLAAVDIVYVEKGLIRKVFLWDAAVEALMVGGWAAAEVLEGD